MIPAALVFLYVFIAALAWQSATGLFQLVWLTVESGMIKRKVRRHLKACPNHGQANDPHSVPTVAAVAPYEHELGNYQ